MSCDMAYRLILGCVFSHVWVETAPSVYYLYMQQSDFVRTFFRPGMWPDLVDLGVASLSDRVLHRMAVLASRVKGQRLRGEVVVGDRTKGRSSGRRRGEM